MARFFEPLLRFVFEWPLQFNSLHVVRAIPAISGGYSDELLSGIVEWTVTL